VGGDDRTARSARTRIETCIVDPGPDPRYRCCNETCTGVTRGKQLVVIVGQKKAIAIAVRNVSGRRRWSKLDEWLRAGAPSRSTKSLKRD
jgi:hypothetical protein